MSGIALAQASDNEVELQGQVWQLQGVEYGNDETLTISEPDQYTIEFGDEGLILVRADCNYGSGSYEQNGSQLSIELGVLTRAQCLPASLSETYLRDLGFVASYVLEEGDLFLSLKADGGIMQFSPASPKLVGPVWTLTEMIFPDYRITLMQPGDYTLSFDDEDGVAVKADCNQSTGTYSLSDPDLSITLGPTTLAACPPHSLADPYLQSLGQAATYAFQEGQLWINPGEEGGLLVFEASDVSP